MSNKEDLLNEIKKHCSNSEYDEILKEILMLQTLSRGSTTDPTERFVEWDKNGFKKIDNHKIKTDKKTLKYIKEHFKDIDTKNLIVE